jgi:DNA gyrase/topoisomerase IV subunit A
VIFISQFFGRAERVMEESKVKELWKTLLFLNDFVKALEEQSKISREKQTKQHAEDTTIKKEKKSKVRNMLLSSQQSRTILEIQIQKRGSTRKVRKQAVKKEEHQKWQTQNRQQKVLLHW